MDAKKLLEQKGIDPNKPVLLIDRTKALDGIWEATSEFCPNIDLSKMSKEDLEELVDSLGQNIIDYHPEDFHQERGTLLNCYIMLKKYGLTDEELSAIDFC